MTVDMHIDRVELHLLARAAQELVFQNEIRQPGEEFEVKVHAHIDVVNITAVTTAEAKEIVTTGDWLGNAIIAAADSQFRINGFDVIGVEMPPPENWDFTLSKAKGERKSMGAAISNLYLG